MTQDNDTSRQDALREVMELLDKATPGPWVVRCDGHTTMTTGADDRDVCDDTTYYPVAVDPDDQYAMAAAVNFLREHAPALLSGGGDWMPVSEASALPQDATGCSGTCAVQLALPGKWPVEPFIREAHWDRIAGAFICHATGRPLHEAIGFLPAPPTTPEASK